MARKRATKAKRKTAAPKTKKKAVKKSLRTVKKKRKGKGVHPNSLANLRPFKKGQSGNPGGQPVLASGAYAEWLAMVNEVDPHGRTNAQLMAAGQGLAAIGGNTGAAREIRQATEGDTVNYKFDVSQLTDEQLRRLADGDDPAAILAG